MTEQAEQTEQTEEKKAAKWAKLEPVRQRFRLLVDDMPRMGQLFDAQLPQHEGESRSDYVRRRLEMLLSMAFMLFSNTHPKGKSLPCFTEFATAAGAGMLFATDGIPQLRPTESRTRELVSALNGMLEYGEAYALVLFSDESMGYHCSIPGSVGVEYFGRATECARAAYVRDSGSDEIAKLLAGLFKDKAKAGPGDESPDGGDGKPTADATDNA